MINILKNNLLFMYLILISIVLKSIVLLIIGPQTFGDGLVHIKIAELIFHNNFIFPHEMLDDVPISPYIYSIFYPLSKLIGTYAYAIPNIILGSLIIYIIFKISLLIFENTIIANIASIITTFYPFFNFYSVSALTEIIFIFFLYSSFFYAIRFIKYLHLKDLLLFSFFIAISSLTRTSTALMFIFFVVLFTIIMFKSDKKKYTLKYIFLFIVTFYGTMSPWIIRNYLLTNDIIITTVALDGNFAFYMGNNPLNQTGGGINRIDYDLSKYAHINDTNKASQMAISDSLNWIKNNPLDWLVLEYRKFIRFYRVTIYAKQYQGLHYKLLSIFSYGVVLLLFLYGLILSTKKLWLLYSPMILFSILLTGVHMLIFASVRYRLPIEPFMIIVGSYALYTIIIRVRKNIQ